MRSGSTLLLHLLMTNSNVSGCGERNRVYRDERDLETFAVKTLLERRRLHWPGYFVDQVNHSHFLPSTDLLLQPSVLPVILFREPRAAVGSMVDVFSRIHDFTVTQAIEHYRERVRTLAGYAALLQREGRFIALTYDELVDHPHAELARLQEYIGLERPLDVNYPTFAFTGTRGDPSSRILAGRILPARKDHGVSLDLPVVDELTAIYEECRQATGRHA